MGTVVTLGRGVYEVGLASRLTNIAAQSLRRWVGGYQYLSGKTTRSLPPVFAPEYGCGSGAIVMSFLDLQQARAIASLRTPVRGRRLSLQSIRRWVEVASERWQTPYPLAHARLRHDGHRIWAVAGDGEHEHLLDVFTNQTAMRVILDPFLHAVQYGDDNLVATWWPGANWGDVGRSVVVNPEYRFGHPVAASCKIETRLLAAVASANRSAEVAARWYEVPIEDVRASVAFEDHLARRVA